MNTVIQGGSGYVGGSGGGFSQGGGSVSASGGASGLLGLGDLFTVLAVIFAVVVVLAVVGVFVIVVVANRAEPDASGRRPQSVYFFAVSFITLLTSVIGSITVVSALVRFIGSHPAAPASGPNAFGNSVARACVLGALITVVSLVLLVTHLRRGLALARAGEEATSPVRRVAQSYVSAVSFIFVLVVLVTVVAVIYLVFALIGPGVFGSMGGRASAGRSLIDTAYVGAVAVAILLTHRNLVAPGIRLWGRSDGVAGAGGTAGTAVPPGVPG